LNPDLPAYDLAENPEEIFSILAGERGAVGWQKRRKHGCAEDFDAVV
jgi:hypothetical protein